jgi:hypothetical protein
MASKQSARAEAKFMRGDTGVDGAATREDVDPTLTQQAKAREALYRGRTWLGREALTWLLWKSESSEDLLTVEKRPLKVVLIDKVTLRSAAGEVTEVAVKGITSPYSGIVRQALERGILVHSARMQLSHGEQSYEVTLDAEWFDLRAAKLPALMQEDESEQLSERLELVSRLGRLVDAILEAFMAERTSPRWRKSVMPQMLEWMREQTPTHAKREAS